MAKYDQPLNASSRISGTLEVTPEESEAETGARLERSREHQRHQLWRERLILVSVTVGLSVLFLFSLVTISLPGSTAEARSHLKNPWRAQVTSPARTPSGVHLVPGEGLSERSE